MPRPARDDVVLVGRISGLFGVKGWVKVFSYTTPREAILKYRSIRLKLASDQTWREFKFAEGQVHGRGVVARLNDVDDRNAAQLLIGAELSVTRLQLPKLKRGEYYWADLEGLKVINLLGEELGAVIHLFETGANDVMVVQAERERLIPYIAQVIREVDLDGGIVRVDWDKDF